MKSMNSGANAQWEVKRNCINENRYTGFLNNVEWKLFEFR